MTDNFPKMLDYLKHKAKRHQAEPPQSKSPLLSPTDEQFLELIVPHDETPPPLPERHPDRPTGASTGGAEQVVTENRELQPEEDVAPEKKGEGEVKAKKEHKRWSILQKSFSKKGKKKAAEAQADAPVTPGEGKSGIHELQRASPLTSPLSASTEEHDITIALEKLNLSAEGTSAFSLSKETRELVQRFTVILKDLVNGVPTAYDDLVKLLDDSSSQLQNTYHKMPSYLQKLVTSLPSKLSSLAPEALAMAAESQGAATTAAATSTTAGSASTGGLGAAAAVKAGLQIPSLKELVTKPGAVVGMLKAIMNVLKLRWPAFIGTNVLWSLGLFVLLFVFWYCHKRGKEVRLEREKSEAGDDAPAGAGDAAGEPLPRDSPTAAATATATPQGTPGGASPGATATATVTVSLQEHPSGDPSGGSPAATAASPASPPTESTGEAQQHHAEPAK
ncbi:hypothetical protein FGG08_002906 [Glutinoglossum americanum]|uniref:Ring-like domain-containing protein n=1 Tax=Glutinoglossum americanum TaxID=1670608 RepID=A0A9P8I8A0_9PEZI|nr:hypothetical protein FGG08_002906 [Glutinoglossum americanum]